MFIWKMYFDFYSQYIKKNIELNVKSKTLWILEGSTGKLLHGVRIGRGFLIEDKNCALHKKKIISST